MDTDKRDKLIAKLKKDKEDALARRQDERKAKQLLAAEKRKQRAVEKRAMEMVNSRMKSPHHSVTEVAQVEDDEIQTELHANTSLQSDSCPSKNPTNEARKTKINKVMSVQKSTEIERKVEESQAISCKSTLKRKYCEPLTMNKVEDCEAPAKRAKRTLKLKTRHSRKCATASNENQVKEQKIKRITTGQKSSKMKENWKERARRYREIQRSDPVLAEQLAIREHARYLKRKQSKQIKLVADMNEREKRRQRKRWRENTRQYRNKQAMANLSDRYMAENSPAETLFTSPEVHLPTLEIDNTSFRQSARQKLGRKKVRRDRSRAYARLKEVEQKLQDANRKANRYKKRLQRLTKTMQSNAASPTPRKKVTNFLRGRKVDKDVRKKLVYFECMNKQLEENAKKASGDRQRQIFTRAVSGSILRRYRMLSTVKKYCSWWRYNKLHSKQKSNKLDAYIRRKRKEEVRVMEREQVLAFLEDDSNSTLCAGKKEYLSRGGQRKQKRYLCDSLINLHIKFCQLNNTEMSYTLFCKLRPFWIVEPKVADRQTCLCVRHENMKLLVQKIHQLGLIKEKNPDEVCIATVCNKTSKTCMYGECEECKSKVVESSLTETDAQKKSFYYRWTTKNEKRNRVTDNTEITVKITAKEKCEATYEEMMNCMQTNLVAYKQHAYRVYHQQTALNEMKSHMSHTECILIVDFSENYMCKYSSETQSVHFGASRQQVTLHTAVLYYKVETAENALRCASFCTISPCLRHDPSSICAHLQPVFKFISENLEKVETIAIWSDGPTTQYRNKRNFALFTKLTSSGKFSAASWNFTESGHGKGPADGIGGSIKRHADGLVAHGVDIPSAEALHVALQGSTATHIAMITESDIANIDLQYQTVGLKSISGTMKLHQLTWTAIRPDHVGLRYLSCVTCQKDKVCDHYDAGGFIKLQVIQSDHPTSEVTDSVQKDTLACQAAAEVSGLPAEVLKEATILPQTDQFLLPDVTDVQKPEGTELSVGDYVAAIYDNKWYPGVVQSVDDATVTVNFMTRSGKHFLWPMQPYIATLPFDELLCKVNGKPTPVSKTRLRLADSQRIDALMMEFMSENSE